jgi:SecD/SecF fusion protein
MQGKGIIRFFLVAMVLVSLVQYLFMLPTRKVEKQAEEFANKTASNASEEERPVVLKAARAAYLDSMSSETVLKIPLLPSFTYQDLKSRQLALGLDLKGGMSVVLQVDLRELIRSLANNAEDPTLNEALEKATAAQANTQDDYVTLFVRNWRAITKEKLAPLFATTLEGVNYETSDGEVERELRKQADKTVNLTFQMLSKRIDKLGVTQPNISVDEARDLITVELPGIDNPERARTFLQAAAALEFWEAYRITDNNLFNAFIEADTRLATQLKTSEDKERTIQRIDTTYQVDSTGNFTQDIARIDTIYEQDFVGGPLLSNISLFQQGSVLGFVERNKKDLVMGYLSREDMKSLFPKDIKFMYSRQPVVDPTTKALTTQYELYAVKVPRNGKAPLEGDVVTNASADPDPNTGQMQVSLNMNQRGAKTWANMTTKAANEGNREIAIVLDNEVVSAPRVNGPITGGRSSITGNFTTQEAKDLASILEVGKLPAKTQIVQESLVGPSLGADNIRRSVNALLAGLVILVMFMIMYYGGGGIVSILTLLLNIIFIFGTLASFGTVLTLPGIAGIVLTIGMAVDANVIIFERIKEELRDGKALRTAIQDGFQNSYSAIFDANTTTFIVAMILNYFGLGPIKGFAVVLMIGVISSMFTAVFVGRLIVEAWLSKDKRRISFFTGVSKTAFSNIQIDWLSKRRIAYIISGTVITAGIVAMLVRGFALGVDFKGGYSYTVKFEQSIDPETLRSTLTETFDGATPVVKAVDVANTYNIVTDYLISSTDTAAANLVMERLFEGVNQIVGGNLVLSNFRNPEGAGTYVTQSSKVGPTIADDIQKSAIYASIFSLLAIFLYILIRFGRGVGRQQIAYPVGAVAALFHDVLFVLGMFALLHGILPFSLEIDQAFIGAILTVIGYSINDTVIIFDRIREVMNQYTNRTKEEIINLAVNSTISRTVITSFTTLLVVALLFIFGGSSLKGFSFALLIGIFVGTYSTVFIATPIVSDIIGDLKPREVKGTGGKQQTLTKSAAKAKIKP